MGHIQLVGVELEGGWNRSFDDVPFVRDVSVHDLGTEHEGELVSPPLPPDGVGDWIRGHYPDEVNNGCGLHVHISFKEENKLDYSRCMDMDYYRFYLKRYDEIGKKHFPNHNDFWTRFRGENRFCKKEFIPHEQLHLREKGEQRRTHLNFPYDMHKTIESRMLPCFKKADDAVIAVQAFIDLTEEYLQGKGKEKSRGMVVRSKKVKPLIGKSTSVVPRREFFRI